MELSIADNLGRTFVDILAPEIEAAFDVRVAVAFASANGVSLILPAINAALARGAYIEFLVGLDVSGTEPEAVRQLMELSQRYRGKAVLLCWVPNGTQVLFHPKMYLARNNSRVLASVGSSNLTRRGLTSNVEVNLVLCQQAAQPRQPDSHLASLFMGAYLRIRSSPAVRVPDAELLRVFSSVCEREQVTHLRAPDAPFPADVMSPLLDHARTLSRPRPATPHPKGWLELVYDALAEGESTTEEIYAHEEEFRQHYPDNRNIRAKIRQQLQYLRDLGFVEHVGPGRWRKRG